MTQIENIKEQVARLKAKWTGLAATGNHAEAVGVENEITALTRASARYEVQEQAEAVEAARLKAVDAAQATLAQIERHRGARTGLEQVVGDIEAAAKALDAAMTRLEPAWTQAVATWPRNVTFKDSDQQAAYDDALGSAGHYPKYEPLRLRLRLPVVLDTIAKRLMGGLAHILSVADARF